MVDSEPRKGSSVETPLSCALATLNSARNFQILALFGVSMVIGVDRSSSRPCSDFTLRNTASHHSSSNTLLPVMYRFQRVKIL